MTCRASSATAAHYMGYVCYLWDSCIMGIVLLFEHQLIVSALVYSFSYDQGHYIAYLLDQAVGPSGILGKKQWIRCDDESVTVVTEDEVRDAEA